MGSRQARRRKKPLLLDPEIADHADEKLRQLEQQSRGELKRALGTMTKDMNASRLRILVFLAWELNNR